MKNLRYLLDNIDKMYNDKTNEFKFYVSEIINYYIDNDYNFSLTKEDIDYMANNIIYNVFVDTRFNIKTYIENEFQRLVV